MEVEKKENQFDKIRSIIEKGSEIGGSVAGTAIGLAIAGPAGALAGALGGPLVSEVFKKVGLDISEKVMGPRERARVGETYSKALEMIVQKLEKGEEIRNDDFFSTQPKDRSKSESILEGTLLKARNEYEEKKLNFYSNLLSNLSFDKTITFEKGNTLLKILEQMSYRQVIILAYLFDIESLSMDDWDTSFKDNSELGDYQDFYSELIELYDKQILQQTGIGISMSIRSLGISPLGRTMGLLIGANNIDEGEKAKIRSIIESISSKVENK